MRFDYWLFNYYRRYARRRLIFDLCVIVVFLSLIFYFFDNKSAVVSAFTSNVQTGISKLEIMKRLRDRNEVAAPSSSKNSSEVIFPSTAPRSCLSSDARGCVCYDQYTVVIRDFPEDRCQDIVKGFARF